MNFPKLGLATPPLMVPLRLGFTGLVFLGLTMMMSEAIVYAQPKPAAESFHLCARGELVHDIACSPDGKTIVVSTDWHTINGRLFVFDYPSGRLRRVMTEPRCNLHPIVFSPDGKQLAAACYRRVQIWDVGTGKLLMDHDGHWFPFVSMCFSRDGKLLVTGGGDHQVKVWDVAKRELRANFRLPLGNTGRRPVTFGAGKWREVGFDEPRDRAPLCVELKIPIDNFYNLVLLPDDKTVAVATEDKRVSLWDVTTGKNLRFLKTDHRSGVGELALTPNGRFLVTRDTGLESDDGIEDGSVRLWDLADPSKRRIVLRKHEKKGGYRIRFSADGKTLVTSEIGKVTVWDVTTDRERFTIKGKGGDHLCCYTISPDGKLIVAFSHPQKLPRLRFWDLATGKELPMGKK